MALLVAALPGSPAEHVAPVRWRSVVLRHDHALALRALRGGALEDADDVEDDIEDDLADDGEDDLDTDLEDDGAAGDASSSVDAGLDNPFLGGGAPGAPGAPGGLEDLAQTLKDPAILQEALKELQDPATQQRIKALLDDPEFRSSMQQYVEQITSDPQFEQLKQQSEQLMQATPLSAVVAVAAAAHPAASRAGARLHRADVQAHDGRRPRRRHGEGPR